MDVGADNFRFNLDTKNGLVAPVQTVRQPSTTELHLDSLDRYLPIEFNNQNPLYFPQPPITSQTLAKLAGPIVQASSESGTNCLIQNARPLSYGYYGRIALTQFNMKWRLPTIVSLYNNTFVIGTATNPAGAGLLLRTIVIPQGYWQGGTSATTAGNGFLAYTITQQMQVFPELALATCSPPTRPELGFTFATNDAAVYMAITFPAGPTGTAAAILALRTGRTLGFNRPLYGYPEASTGAPLGAPTYYNTAVSGGPPNFLYTDYVDIVSTSLTNYKDAKDTNTSLNAPGAVLGRIWLTEGTSNAGNNETVGAAAAPADATRIGQQPLSVMKTWTWPNWCQWSPNQTINTIDIKLLDMWGDLIPWSSTYPTEWSATLTLTE